MRRWLLAVAALLVGAVSASYADYIIIQYNLTAPKDDGEKNDKGPQYPGGAGGQPAGFPPGPGGGGFPGGPGPGGQGGGTGAPGPGGAGPGGQGGGTGAPGPGGMRPGGMPGGMMPGGMPGGMMPGGFPGGGMPGQFAQAEEDVPLAPLYVLAVVETKNSPNYNRMLVRREPTRIDHRWGTTWLQPITQQGTAVHYIPIIFGKNPVPSVAKRFDAKWREAHSDKEGKATSDQLLDLAEWALAHGALTEFEKTMDELAQTDKDSRAAAAYVKVKADLDRGSAENPAVGVWKSKLGMENYKIAQKDKGHYTMLYGAGSGGVTDTDERLALLENTCRGFYYWFALKEIALPAPAERLLAIVVPQAREFDRTHEIFDSPSLVADGFYARRDNLLIFSANRLDEPYKNLEAYMEPALRQPNQDLGTLLKGKGPYAVQTAALMLKALQLDGEVAASTQEVPRQLLAASGMLPRNVEIPQWIEFGAGSFFGTAKSSPWPSLGSSPCALMAGDNYLVTYKAWSKAKKLDDPKTALKRVVTDQYFRLDKDGKDKLALHKARTLSWALTFFLARKKTEGLRRYFNELARLPRDLPLDDQMLFACFARAFDLLEVSDPGKVNEVRLGQLANEWNDYITLMPGELEEIMKKVQSESEMKTAPGGRPGP